MNNISKQNYLWADARQPLITTGSFKTEARLYNLSDPAQAEVSEAFMRICNKVLRPSTPVTGFSGGEKVILMALMSLFSPAPRLCFIDLWHALDPGKRLLMKELIAKCPKDIIFEDSSC